MEVYIEYVIIDNLIVDFLLLNASLKTCGVKHSWQSVLLGSVIGTAFAVFMPFMRVSGALFFIIKLLVGEVMLFASGKFKSFGGFAKTFAILLLYTFALGGSMLGVGFMLGFSFSPESPITNFSTLINLPVGLIILFTALGIKLLYLIIFGKEKEKAVRPFFREVAFFDGGESVLLNGFIDTGNKLYDSKSGKPVSIIGKSLANKLVLNGGLKMRGAHYVRCSTVSGEGKILVFEIDRLVIYCGDDKNIIDNAMVGISPHSTDDADVIIHSGLVGGL